MKKYYYFFKLIRPLNCFIAFIAVLVSIFVLNPDFIISKFFVSVLASTIVLMVCGAGNVLNDYLDKDIDRTNHPDRPIPSGKVSASEALVFSIVLFMLALSLSIYISLVAKIVSVMTLFITILSMLIIVTYEGITKSKGLSGNICVSVLTGLVFIYAGSVVSEYLKATFLFLLAFVANLGREIAKDIEDLEGDRSKRRTLPMKIGVQRAKGVSAAMFLSAIALSPFPHFIFSFTSKYIALIMLSDAIFIIASVMLFYNVRKAQKISKVAMIVGLVAYFVGKF